MDCLKEREWEWMERKLIMVIEKKYSITECAISINGKKTELRYFVYLGCIYVYN